jgi:hypothetical protein
MSAGPSERVPDLDRPQSRSQLTVLALASCLFRADERLFAAQYRLRHS